MEEEKINSGLSYGKNIVFVVSESIFNLMFSF